MTKREIEARKKSELINFIQWKCRYDEDLEETIKECRKMSYHELREWAIRNDIID